MSKDKLLKKIIKLESKDVIADIDEFENNFSSKDAFVENEAIVRKDHILKGVEKFKNGLIKADQLIEWSEFIEMEDSIEFENEETAEYIFMMANPLLCKGGLYEVVKIITNKI